MSTLTAAKGPSSIVNAVKFDPDKHLVFRKPDAVYTWTSLGFSKNYGASSFCAAEPFQLFSTEAIELMRNEVLDQETLEKFCYSDNNTAMSIRGYAAESAPFTFDAWKHPQTLEILSDVAGVDLTVRMDYELGHVNFGIKSGKVSTAVQAPGESLENGLKVNNTEVVGWHKDSYPFSATLMLSDSTDMIVGELAVQLEGGKLHKLQMAKTGCVVLLQGRYLLHTGLRAHGPRVRMTMVTPLWPSSSFFHDETWLTYVRAISDTSKLYSQYADYRLKMLADRIEAQRQVIREQQQTKLDTRALKAFIEQQINFLQQTNVELLEEDQIDRWGYKLGIPAPQLLPKIRA
ncbi:hypothetical protein diail_10017 [Diaporthe ilicicola]|nr:hypothetical protein diail_10017 [Diaporthe ilicicola]